MTSFLDVIDQMNECRHRIEMVVLASRGLADRGDGAAFERHALDLLEKLERIRDALDNIRSGGEAEINQ